MPVRTDDATISDDSRLWRRIYPEWIHTEADGSHRPSSVSFIDRLSFELSVHVAAMTTIDAVLANYPTHSVAEIDAGFIRDLGYALVREPTPSDPSHALICPSPTKSHAKRCVKQAIWAELRLP